jgi:hypothetical protein
VADEQLQRELLYDTQKYEAGKGKAKAAAEFKKNDSIGPISGLRCRHAACLSHSCS